MAIIKNVEMWFAKLDPLRPNAKYNKDNPTWELQIRTSDKNEKAAWVDMGLSVKAVLPDEGAPYWRVNLRKKSVKTSKEASSPVEVLDANLEPLDPNSIGNGSIGNIRIFQYEYPKADGSRGIACVLMGIQVLTHILYVPAPRQDGFHQVAGGTKTIAAKGKEDSFVPKAGNSAEDEEDSQF
jgi:hypothetical protein